MTTANVFMKGFMIFITLFLMNLNLSLSFDFKELEKYVNTDYKNSIDSITKLHEKERNELNKSKLQILLGNNYTLLHSYRLAIRHFENGLKNDTLDDNILISALNTMGYCYEQIRSSDKAAESYLKALKIAEENKNEKEINRSYINLGKTHAIIRNYELAKDFMQKALNMAIKLRDTMLMAHIYNDFAGINHLYLSGAINKISGKNFNRFLNSFRVEEAQKLLNNKELEGLTIEEIAIKSGFSSANTFYRHFKEITGITPNQFKKANN